MAKDKELVIVESPAKARTIQSLLGDRYQVKASVGHVRDLPKQKLGVDVDNGFTPQYEVPKAKQAVVKELTDAAKRAPVVYLATDPDREGEAISWHLLEATGLKERRIPVRRVVFHEVTKAAVDEAFRHPRDIDMNLVEAQQARRILDRLVGYKLSPLLWRKVRRGLSAGRVQSVALRLIVEREREVEGFVPQEYWGIDAELAKRADGARFVATLHGRWDEKDEISIPDAAAADALCATLSAASYRIADVQRRQQRRRPPAPFTTSSLQQEAFRSLRFTARRTMAVAQQLYEGLPLGSEGPVGLITYMRTDSTQVAATAVAEARAYIADAFSADHVAPRPPTHKKAKGAQEAHEAIRPTSVRRLPESLRGTLTPDQLRLYGLIWRRFVASQMAPAVVATITATIRADASPQRRTDGAYRLRASHSHIIFDGFYAVAGAPDDDPNRPPLPSLAVGDALDLIGLKPEQHFTQPPPRFTEASLVKALEENGIGRPSTYAPTIATLLDRSYVERLKGSLHPTALGGAVTDLLIEHFPDFIDVGFTAQMEAGLDEIARGEEAWVPVVRQFYAPLDTALERAATIERVRIQAEPVGEDCPECGRPLVTRHSRNGPFVACSGYPECRYVKRETAPAEATNETCPECGRPMVARHGRYGPFVACSGYPECRYIKRQQAPAEATNETCPECGRPMAVRRSRYGPFLACTGYPECKHTKRLSRAGAKDRDDG